MFPSYQEMLDDFGFPANLIARIEVRTEIFGIKKEDTC